jgi:hypothetical protein
LNSSRSRRTPHFAGFTERLRLDLGRRFDRLRDVAENVPLSQADLEETGAIYARIVKNERASPLEIEMIMQVIMSEIS